MQQQPFIAQFVTWLPDGAPQATPVWVDVDPANPYRFVTLRGRIVEHRHEGADQQIDALAKKYLGQDTYPMRQPGEQRVMLRIAPDHFLEQGD